MIRSRRLLGIHDNNHRAEALRQGLACGLLFGKDLGAGLGEGCHANYSSWFLLIETISALTGGMADYIEGAIIWRRGSRVMDKMRRIGFN